jgi:Zn finger protein HypA/HybF involved in hydrogenase expression
MSLKEIEVTTEICPHCDSEDIKLRTPDDEEENEFFDVVCNTCKGQFIVVPQQNKYFIVKKGIGIL